MKRKSLNWITMILVCVSGTLFAETSATNTISINVPEKYEIKSYSPKKGLVGIKSSAGQTNLPFSAFNPEQQQDITAWLIDKAFQGSGLKIDIETSKTTDKVHYGGSYGGLTQGARDTVNYTITINNQSEVAFQEIVLEYRIFYTTRDGNDERHRYIISAHNFDLASKDIQKVNARIQLRDEKFTDPSSSSESKFQGVGSPTVYTKDRLLGLYVCVSKTDRNGKLIQIESEDGNIPDKEKWKLYTQVISPDQSSELR